MLTTINDHIINYEILKQQLLNNEKPVLIFLHDGLGSINQWKEYPQKICEAVNLAGIVYDRPGYGSSLIDEIDFKCDYLQNQAAVVLPEFLASLNIKHNIILIGHSDGASIALIFASLFPENLMGVISESAHIFVEDITLNGIKKLRMDYLSDKYLSNSLKKYHGDKTDLLFNAWSASWLSDEFRNWNIEKLLTAIKVPVMAIQGADDEYGSKYQLDSIESKINTEVEMHFIKDCKHFPHFEKENKVFNLMKDFINRIITD